MPVLKFGRTLCVFGKKEIWDVITWTFKTRFLEMQVAERKRRERQVLTVLRPHEREELGWSFGRCFRDS